MIDDIFCGMRRWGQECWPHTAWARWWPIKSCTSGSAEYKTDQLLAASERNNGCFLRRGAYHSI